MDAAELAEFFCLAVCKPAKVQVFSGKIVYGYEIPAIMQEFRPIFPKHEVEWKKNCIFAGTGNTG